MNIIRWGSGIFEADAPADYLTIVARQIVEKIHECIDKGADHQMGEAFCCETFVMPGVDILLTLTKSYSNAMVPILMELPVDQWQSWYLGVFDKYEFVNRDDPFVQSRRKIIVQTFAELKLLIGDEQEED